MAFVFVSTWLRTKEHSVGTGKALHAHAGVDVVDGIAVARLRLIILRTATMAL